mgnify:CR=1 FL=1
MGRELVYLMESDLPTYNGQDLLDNLYLFAHLKQLANPNITHYTIWPMGRELVYLMESDLPLDMVAGVDSSIPLIAKSSLYAKKGGKEFLNSGMYIL